ncbi:MAG: O-antigen ligase family protein [Bacteroidia bacterium]
MLQRILISVGRLVPSPESRIAALLVAGVFMPPFLQVLIQVIWLGYLGWQDWNRPQVNLFKQAKLIHNISRPAWAQILLVTLTLISLLWTSDFNEGWIELISKLPLFTWPIAFALAAYQFPGFQRSLLRWTWMSSGVVGLACVIDVLLRSQGPGFWFADMVYENLARISGLHPIYLSIWVLMGMLAYFEDRVAGPANPKGPLEPARYPAFIAHVLYLGGSLIFLTLLSSRMALLTAFLLLTASVYFLYRTKRLRLVHAPLFLLALLLPVVLIKSNEVNRSRYGEMVNLKGTYQSDRWGGRALRIEKWKHTLRCYLRFPVLGTGAGDFQKELLDTYRQNQFSPGLEHRFNSHNQYLQTLATLGPLGLALLLAWLLIPLRWHWEDRHWLGIAAVLLVASSMITESLLERQKGIYLVGLLANGYFCFRKDPTNPHPTNPHPIDPDNTEPHEPPAPQAL